MARYEIIKIDYIGSVISVNHYKYAGGRFTRKETKQWMEELGWLIKPLHFEDWTLPLGITCDGVFRDLRSAPDLSNLSKVICDAIEEVTGINDKNFRWHDGERVIDKSKSPFLLITIRENDTKLPSKPLQSKSRHYKVKYH